MKIIISCIISALFALDSFSQNNFIAIIKNEANKQPLAASLEIKSLKVAAVANDSGIVLIKNIPNGKYEVTFSHVGYLELERSFSFPLNSDTIRIFLEAGTKELEEITVNSTRTNRSINSTPTRVEVIGSDEIREEAEMRPGDVRMLLSETTGIQAQQTSATSATANLRIQGLDGRYTQILKDGFPLYSGAATGLGILQIPPLDLRQLEIIKGSASTLFGGGAIAGLINLISKTPGEKRELSFHANVTSAGGLDLNSYYSERFKKTGVTFFVSRNSNNAFDPAGISFSAIPKFERYTINPKLFFYFSDKTKLNFGINTTFENRIGGDMSFIAGKGDSNHSYFERNKTQRFSTQLSFDHRFNEKNSLSFKNSVSYFDRTISSRGYVFHGIQYSSFTEASYTGKMKNSDWVAGLNFLTDHFTENQGSPVPADYDQNTIGAFAQNTWNASDGLTIETGVRADHVNRYGFALLPRVSLLFNIAKGLTSRIGGGLGYKPPTIFTEESEKLLYKNVLPVSDSVNRLERSYGVNADINYRTSFENVKFTINQFFFFTVINHPLFLQSLPGNFYKFQNITGHLDTKGAETNVKISIEDLDLYLGYTFIDAKVHNNGAVSQNPLSPKHRFNAALVWEIENKWRIGSELYYFSKQLLSDGSTGRSYWLYGLVVERSVKKILLYINFENIGNVRQTKFENIYTGTITNPVFKDIYAPLEGFVMNGGIKIRLYSR